MADSHDAQTGARAPRTDPGPFGGVVVRYGQFYGPGTYYEHEPPAHPRIHVDDAARATPPLFDAESGIVTIVEPR